MPLQDIEPKPCLSAVAQVEAQLVDQMAKSKAAQQAVDAAERMQSLWESSGSHGGGASTIVLLAEE